jgi:hypothetical protein
MISPSSVNQFDATTTTAEYYNPKEDIINMQIYYYLMIIICSVTSPLVNLTLSHY